MCGIVGLVNWGDRETLERMNDLQAHRGPDDWGVWEGRFPCGSWVGLGNRRLSIIDLSAAGHMPMSNAEGTIVITYNGELYNAPELRRHLESKNRAFRSKTDTEVVLQLYEEEGPSCLKRLNGMFAFCICDLRNGPNSPSLFMVRDQFGVKPFYYLHHGNRLAFASEVKSLLGLPGFEPRMDLEALHQYLTFLWVPDPKTLLQDVRKLPAGHYALFQSGQLTIERYWDLELPDRNAGFPEADEEALAEELRERFRRSVRGQMVSDVPIGAFLSAGLDSSSIVAMMAEASSHPVRTYTISFPRDHMIGEHTLDDPAVSRQVAQRFGCEHHEIAVEPKVADLLPRLIWHMDEPVADPAIILTYLICREASSSVKVLLSGIGGDELFAGYRKYYAHNWAKVYRMLPSALRRGVVSPLIRALPAMRGTPFKGMVRLANKMVRSGSLSPQDAFLMNCTYLDGAHKAQLYSSELNDRLSSFDAWMQHRLHFGRVSHAEFLNQMLYLDLKAFMVSLNLNYNDKMSMASSIEVRVPFLDPELAHFAACRVPPRLKLRGFLRPVTKYIFRKAQQSILPKQVLSQPKAGFGAPIDHWLAHDLSEMVDDLLSESQLRKRGLFKPSAVRSLVAAHRSGKADWSLQVWQLLTLEIWMQTYLRKS